MDLIVSIPHGGSLKPEITTDRRAPSNVDLSILQDRHTQPIGLLLAARIAEMTGKRPHVVLMHLHRIKVDANRDLKEPTDYASGSPNASIAWKDYHSFIASARKKITRARGGLLIDIHGHGHSTNRIELGYTISGDNLRLSNQKLNNVGLSTTLDRLLRRLNLRSRNGKVSISDIIRGPLSMGAIMTTKYDLVAVPSPNIPTPAKDEKYFEGGYTVQHNSQLGIDAIQIELPTRYRNLTGNALDKFVDGLAGSVLQFMISYFPSSL
jgi:hypothetical protein